jgi:hypothetical protein
MVKTKSPQIQIPSARSEDQPATRKMLASFRDELKSNICGMEQKMESGFHEIEAGNSRMQLLLEEQNANNRIVLEGLQILWHRQDRRERDLG